MNKRTVRTAQHDDQVIWYMPHGCWERHPNVSWRTVHITLHL